MGDDPLSSKEPREPLERRGAGVSPGLSIGPAYVVDRRQVNVPHTIIDRDAVEDELKRFRTALRGTQDQLEAIKGRLTHGEHRQILKAQQMMLRDPDLIQRTEGIIRDQLIGAEWAVSKTVDEIREKLAKVSDEYFRERQFDIAFMGERLITTLGGEEKDTITPPDGAVVVAHDLSPADTAQFSRFKVAGIVTEEGGQTSHTAIIARALQIPAVVGVNDLLNAVDTGDLVIVDGVHGIAHVRPTQAQIDALEVEVERYNAFEQAISKEHALPAQSDDGENIRLRANLALDEENEVARRFGAEGVGLYRTEFMFMNRDTAPSDEEHYRTAKALLQRWAPHPVRVRTFDTERAVMPTNNNPIIRNMPRMESLQESASRHSLTNRENQRKEHQQTGLHDNTRQPAPCSLATRYFINAIVSSMPPAERGVKRHLPLTTSVGVLSVPLLCTQ